MKFVFLLTVWTHGELPVVYVEDYGLTGEDCIERVEAYVNAYPNWSLGDPSCEIDLGH